MSTLKDKLANSVRQARSATQAADHPRADSAPPRAPATRPRSTPAAPARQESAADAQNPASSASETFPRRVWPD